MVHLRETQRTHRPKERETQRDFTPKIQTTTFKTSITFLLLLHTHNIRCAKIHLSTRSSLCRRRRRRRRQKRERSTTCSSLEDYVYSANIPIGYDFETTKARRLFSLSFDSLSIGCKTSLGIITNNVDSIDTHFKRRGDFAGSIHRYTSARVSSSARAKGYLPRRLRCARTR